MRYLSTIRALAASAFFSVVVLGQSPGSISGRVTLPDGRLITQSIRISLETLRGVKSSVYTDNQGQFIFRSLTPGIYQVIVEGDKNLWETTSVNVEVFPGAPAILTIVLKGKKDTKTTTKNGDTVSTGELETTIPPKAKKEFERASDASRNGKVDEAIAHLRKAIEYFPNYLMAHNDLGAQLLDQGKLDDAETELRKATSIDPKAFNPQLNLGIVLTAQHRYAEAKEVLQKALSLEANSPAARLNLGEALEGLEELELATREFIKAYNLGGSKFAVALFHLGNIYLKTGQRQLAKTSFERLIIEAPSSPDAIEARKLLQQLK